MKLSIVTPVVSLHPGAHGPWEVDATIAARARLGRNNATAGQ